MKNTSKKYYKKFKKICFFLPSLKTGGAEKVLLNIANKISEDKSYKVFFITGNSNGVYKNLLSKKINFVNLKSKRLRYTLFKLVSVLKNEKFDIVLTTMPHTNVFLCLIKKIYNFDFKLLVRQSNIYSIPKQSIKSYLFILLMKLTYRYADIVISNCKAVYRESSTIFKIEKKKK